MKHLFPKFHTWVVMFFALLLTSVQATAQTASSPLKASGNYHVYTFTFEKGENFSPTSIKSSDNLVTVYFTAFDGNAYLYNAQSALSVNVPFGNCITRVELNGVSGGPMIVPDFGTFNNNVWTTDEEEHIAVSFWCSPSEPSAEVKSITVYVNGFPPTYATVKSVSPAPGDIQIGGNCSGLCNIKITMDGTWDNSVYNSDSTPLPDGLTLVGPNGPVTIVSNAGIQMWSYTSDIIFITDPYILDTPGTYTLTIPEGINTINGNPNPAMEYTWNVLAKNTFEFDEYDTFPIDKGEECNHWHWSKQLDGFTINVPEGIEFVDVPSTVTIEVAGGDYDFAPVTCGVAYADGVLTFTFPKAYTEKGTVFVKIPYHTFTSTTGAANENCYCSFIVDPNDYFYFGLYSDQVRMAPVSSLELYIPNGLEVAKVADTFLVNDEPVSITSYSQEDNILTINFSEDALPLNTDLEFGFNMGFIVCTDGSISYGYRSANCMVIPALTADTDSADPKGYYWTTFTGPRNFMLYGACTPYKVTAVDEANGELIIEEIIMSDDATGRDLILPAGEGILIRTSDASSALNIEFTWALATADMSGNCLIGCTENATWAEPGKVYYRFALDADNTPGSAGFYWTTEGGTSIDAHAGKAYLVLDAVSASNGRFIFGSFASPTAISNIIAAEHAQSLFNFQGQRVARPVQSSLYIKNGQKLIVK